MGAHFGQCGMIQGFTQVQVPTLYALIKCDILGTLMSLVYVEGGGQAVVLGYFH